jgi:hypothetical protein
MRFVCADTSFLIALYTPGDEHNRKASRLFDQLFGRPAGANFVAPWPILYETIRTQFIRDRRSISEMQRHFVWLRSSNRLILLDDSPYRYDELAATFSGAVESNHYRALSLADRVVRRVILSRTPRISGLISSDAGHFMDVCIRARCELIDLRRSQ